MSKRVEPNGGTGARCHPSNNKMKRFNGTIRGREKTFRGLDTAGTHVFEGIKAHYNQVLVPIRELGVIFSEML